MLDSKKLEHYLCLESFHGDSGLLPMGAKGVRVSNFSTLQGGVTNDLYSFLLEFEKEGFCQRFDLVLKAYKRNAGLWLKTCRSDEDTRQYVREFEALKCLERVGFPVPSAFLCECDSSILGYPFVIMRKEKVISDSLNNLDCFATTLSSLHNLQASRLEIKPLKFPKDDLAFARDRLNCLKQFLSETRHYRSIKKDFNFAMSWLESNLAENKCPQYCLIHGEYHPGHVLVVNENKLEVIDWEGVAIGDPAFDVGFAYHMVKLMCNERDPNLGQKTAEQFVLDYVKSSRSDIYERLKFYQVMGILGVTIEVSSWISNPLKTYRLFGNKAFARAIAFPFIGSGLISKKWLNADFIISYLQYFQDFIRTALRQ